MVNAPETVGPQASAPFQDVLPSGNVRPRGPPEEDRTLPPETIEFARRMFDAARNGDEETLTTALRGGLPANMTNDSGNTLLMLSSYAGHLPLVHLLLSHNASPNRLNDRQQSPLSGAVFKNHTDVVRALHHAGADPRLGEPSAVQAAWMFGRREWLAEWGVDESEVQECLHRLGCWRI